MDKTYYCNVKFTKMKIDLENRTIKGEELLTNISEDELLNSLDQLISEYEQATDSDECKKIKRENNFIYKQILFFTNCLQSSIIFLIL